MQKSALLAGGLLACASIINIDAQAADLSSIQWPWSAPETYSDIPSYDWSGGYVAIMGGYNSSNITSGDLAANMVDLAIPDWKYGDKAKSLAKAATRDMTANAGVYSLHAGINVMSQRLVYGAEIEYGRFSPAMNGKTGFDEGREVEQTTSSNAAGQSVVERISVRTVYDNRTQILDFGLINGRAGYAYGRFMPFALVGLGVTRVKVAAKMFASELHNYYVDLNWLSGNVVGPAPAVLTKDAYAATVSLGLGFEYAVTDNVLLRAQYNYMTAGNVKGEGISNNMARGGLALKF